MCPPLARQSLRLPPWRSASPWQVKLDAQGRTEQGLASPGRGPSQGRPWAPKAVDRETGGCPHASDRARAGGASGCLEPAWLQREISWRCGGSIYELRAASSFVFSVVRRALHEDPVLLLVGDAVDHLRKLMSHARAKGFLFWGWHQFAIKRHGGEDPSI